MLTVYLENVWQEIITQKGRRLFLEKGVELASNLFKENPKQIDELDSIDLVIATNPDLKLLEKARIRNIKSIFFALFPDQILGWDYENNKYRGSVSDVFKEGIYKAKLILANSYFTKGLVEKAIYLPSSVEVCYLGVDSKSISKIETLCYPTNNLRVLWNHMWRSDKGFEKALEIILELAQEMPFIDFFIGRKESFAGKKINKMRRKYGKFIVQVKEKKLSNIHILDYFESQQDYWSFLKTIDVSFSCSYHETFGLSMLEQQAAGIACVIPHTEVYTEIHAGSYMVPKNDIKNGIRELINNPGMRAEVSKACIRNSNKYSIERFVDSFFGFVRNVLNKK